MSARAAIRRILTPPLIVLAVLVVLFEATFWRWMTGLGHWLAARIPVFAWLERLVERLSPRWVGIVFAVPLIALVPIKLTAVWLMVHRHFVSGLVFLIAAKMVATAFSARLFALARPKLMQLPLFAWAYGKVTGWIAFAHAYVEALPAWRRAKAIGRAIKHRLTIARAGIVSRLWAAALRRAARFRTPAA